MELSVTGSIAYAISNLVHQDSPLSHDDLDRAFAKYGLQEGDIGKRDSQGKPIGKHRRAKAVLSHAADEDPVLGGRLVIYLIEKLRGGGAFRQGSPTCLPDDLVENAQSVLRDAGMNLGDDGTLSPMTLEGLSGEALAPWLALYVRRAREGSEDAALLAGTAKDLVEATARYVIEDSVGSYNPHMKFPGTMLQAFNAAGFHGVTGQEINLRSELSVDAIERFHQSLFLLGLAVNDLRNQDGTGHGRPFLPTVTTRDGRVATQAMAMLAGLLLDL